MLVCSMKTLLILTALALYGYADTIDVYFSPRGGAEEAIVSEINNAKESLLVMAYGFANEEIIGALADANATGRQLYVVLDRTNKTNARLEKIRKSGGEIRIDSKHAIMHDKVIIIDDETVITGSYNFSKNAERRNSENLLVIRSRELVEKYKKHFWERFME